MKDIDFNRIPKLGFGLMRPPMIGEEVDVEQLKDMVDLFLESGFTYFDSAWGYLGGKSEMAARAALVERHPRDSFTFATKLPAWLASNEEAAKQMFYTSLERTGLEYFDFYLLHNLGGNQFSRTKSFDQYGIWDYLAEKKAQGLIRKLGFSMHAKHDHLDEVLTKHPEVDFVQLQINYADWEDSVNESRLCHETARKHGKPVVIMEPVKGGALAVLPESVAGILKQQDPDASLASWGIRFAASLEGIATVLSGMTTIDQMRDNVAYMKSFKPLSAAERDAVERARVALTSIPQVPCTDCQYCIKDCPQNIPIPSVFRALNDYMVYEQLSRSKAMYNLGTRGGGQASACIACAQCEGVCPQSIGIIEQLKKAAELFE